MIENHEFGGTSGDGSEFKRFHVWTPNGKTIFSCWNISWIYGAQIQSLRLSKEKHKTIFLRSNDVLETKSATIPTVEM
jgi:hypothetical protein